MSYSGQVRRGFAHISARVLWGIPLLRAAAVWIALFACAPHAFASPPATTTTLAITSNGSPVATLIQGNLITLTAAVASGSTPLTVGQVEFCDVTPSPGVPAPYCTDIHQLALAQLTSAGTATFHFVPPLGNRIYKAVFLGTNNYASSASSVSPLTVTQSSYKYLSATTLTSNGAPGSYTLTATVTGGGDPAAPSGTVSFFDTSNQNYLLGTATLSPLISGLTFSNSENLSVGGFHWVKYWWRTSMAMATPILPSCPLEAGPPGPPPSCWAMAMAPSTRPRTRPLQRRTQSQ